MTVTKTVESLKKAHKVLIFCHTRPDGDTLGAACALKSAYETLGITADVICPEKVPDKYAFLNIPNLVKSVEEIDGKYDLHVAVDCSTEGMHGENYNLFASCPMTVNIDHHVSNTNYAKINYVQDRAACCEIMYEVINALTNGKISKQTANFLMLGVSTDTGNFAHNNVTANTFYVATKLTECGADIHTVQYEMFKRQTKKRAMLFGHAMNSIQFFHDDRLAVITVRQADLDKFGTTKDVTEGFIDFPLSIDGVEVAVSILESGDKKFKISYRSKGKVDVNQVASTFGGGGHVLASGSMLNGYYEDVLDKLVFTVGNYLD